MRKLVIALLAIALMAGVFAAPAFAQSQTCWGANQRICLGESQSGDAYILMKNSSDFGVYLWMNPQITAVPSSASDLANVQFLLITHTTSVSTGAGYPHVYYGIPDLSIHGVRLSYTHECTNNPTSCS